MDWEIAPHSAKGERLVPAVMLLVLLMPSKSVLRSASAASVTPVMHRERTLELVLAVLVMVVTASA